MVLRGGVVEGASAELKGTSREGVVGALMSAAAGQLQKVCTGLYIWRVGTFRTGLIIPF